MVISSKSSEVSPLVFDYDSSPPLASNASGMPHVQTGMLPVGWHAAAGIERQKNLITVTIIPTLFPILRPIVHLQI